MLKKKRNTKEYYKVISLKRVYLQKTVPKTMTSVIKGKKKRKHPPFNGEPKTDTDLEAVKEMVVNVKK